MIRWLRGKHLVIKTLPMWGWCDQDELILHAAFQCLVDFVEQEQPETVVDWDFDDNYRRAWDEITSLYHWWTVERPASTDYLALNEADQASLHRLVDVMYYLWI